ncbi:MAG TPA: hydroxysqualene dehydroxylase HpnE, partial [Rubrivivax sp.]|nr:hydroxysqualene dehydroxylase HpnE [Rubrivivax sp.]
MKLAIVGGGWAGLAAAVRAHEAGHRVTLFEMAGQLGGRARQVTVEGLALDNGQHILIGAYERCLALMQTVGSDVTGGLDRRPLELRYPDGRGLRMPPGAPWLGFGLAVWRAQGWNLRDRLAVLRAGLRWWAAGFRCDPQLTVDALCTDLPPAVRALLIDPLCVAALNTAATDAGAAVFLRVLRDALFSGHGSSDLLLPRLSLGALLPEPAERWLRAAGVDVKLGQRAQGLQQMDRGWGLADDAFDAVVLACSAIEAARLVEPHEPAWAARARGLPYEPIITVYLRCPGARLAVPMTALFASAHAPAQFVFDHEALGGMAGVFAFVISGAGAWVNAGAQVTGQAVLRQAVDAFPPATWPTPPLLLRVLTEKRATFKCTPALDRPPAFIAPGLVAAGDYVA